MRLVMGISTNLIPPEMEADEVAFNGMMGMAFVRAAGLGFRPFPVGVRDEGDKGAPYLASVWRHISPLYIRGQGGISPSRADSHDESRDKLPSGNTQGLGTL